MSALESISLASVNRNQVARRDVLTLVKEKCTRAYLRAPRPYDRNGDPANESLLPGADQERSGGEDRDADTKGARARGRKILVAPVAFSPIGRSGGSAFLRHAGLALAANRDRWSDRKLPFVMTTRSLIAYAVIALVLLMVALLAGRASLRRRRRRSSREHLRVDLFTADRGRSRS